MSNRQTATVITELLFRFRKRQDSNLRLPAAAGRSTEVTLFYGIIQKIMKG